VLYLNQPVVSARFGFALPSNIALLWVTLASGHCYDRRISGIETTLSPHNLYPNYLLQSRSNNTFVPCSSPVNVSEYATSVCPAPRDVPSLRGHVSNESLHVPEIIYIITKMTYRACPIGLRNPQHDKRTGQISDI